MMIIIQLVDVSLSLSLTDESNALTRCESHSLSATGTDFIHATEIVDSLA